MTPARGLGCPGVSRGNVRELRRSWGREGTPEFSVIGLKYTHARPDR